MKKLLFLSLMVLSYGIAKAQSQENVLRLNSVNTPESFSAKASGYTFTLNESIFSDPNFKEGSSLEVDTESGMKFFTINRISEFVPGMISVSAKSEEGEQFSFTYSGHSINGLFHESDHSRKQFKYDTKAKAHVITRDLPLEFACSHEMTPEEVLPKVLIQNWKDKKQKALASQALAGEPDVNTTIDILAVYSRGAELWAQNSFGEEGIFAALAQAFNLSQTVLDNSEVPVTLRVVYVHKTSFNKPFDHNSGDILRQLTASPTYNPFGDLEDGVMDEVHVLRDQYGADIVSYFDDVNDTGGIAWRLGSRGGSPAFGFNLNRVQQVTTGYTLMHEIGHNMGNSHSRTQEVQIAGLSGGVFMESVGYHNFVDSVHTIMGYGREGFTELPVFSNSRLNFSGNKIGSSNATDFANAAMSVMKIKGVISSYRPSVFEPPVSSVSVSDISLMMDQGNAFTSYVEIENTGESNLDFDLDFETTTGVVAKEKGGTQFLNSDTTVVFETGFETSEGFIPRAIPAANGWRAFSSNSQADVDVIISRDSAKTGTGHLQLLGDGSGSTQFIYSPFYQGFAFGSYIVSYDVLISDLTGIESEQFEILTIDGKTREVNSGISINEGFFFALGRDEQGNTNYAGTNTAASPATYYNVEIEFNSSSEKILYSIDGQLVYEANFSPRGNVPQELLFIHTNTIEGAYLNIDNLSVLRTASPYPWLDLPRFSGSVAPGESFAIPLNFNTFNVGEGEYYANMTITTNEEGGNVTEIPIQLTVSNIVSNEEDDRLTGFSLAQNYPNPFNPSTTISYILNEATDVKLEVFDIQGRKVAVLEDTRKQSGFYTLTFNASELASGIYIYRLTSNGRSLSKRMLLLK